MNIFTAPFGAKHNFALLNTVMFAMVLLTACGGGSGVDDVSHSQANICRPEVSSSDGGGAGDSGSDAGAAGAGLGKFRNAIVQVEQANGDTVGEAEINDTDGLVKFVLCGYSGPVKLTVKAKADSSTKYYDESLQEYVPFPAGQEMHSVVPVFNQHIGITILSEAAWQYLDAKYGPDGWREAAHVTEANEVIRTEFNRLLPAALQIVDITELPALLSERTATNSLTTSSSDIYGVVNSGLARAAGLLRNGDSAAALKIARQMGRDLCDGVLDYACNGAPVIDSADQVAYLLPQLGEFLNAGVGDIATRCATADIEAASLRIVQIKIETSFPYGLSDYERKPDSESAFYSERTPIWLLRNDGKVFFWSTRTRRAVAYEPALTFRQLITQGPLLGVATDGRAYEGRFKVANPFDPKNLQYTEPLPAIEMPGYKDATTVSAIYSPDGSGDQSLHLRQMVRLNTGLAFIENEVLTDSGVGHLEAFGISNVTKVGVARGWSSGTGYFSVTSNGKLYATGGNAQGLLGIGKTEGELDYTTQPVNVSFPGDPLISRSPVAT
ncbi:MAG: hypothetical protein JF606_07160 [Burkholderiales bacterium]|nr:hypothetical protein [Burkholderiales bacterium]